MKIASTVRVFSIHRSSRGSPTKRDISLCSWAERLPVKPGTVKLWLIEPTTAIKTGNVGLSASTILRVLYVLTHFIFTTLRGSYSYLFPVLQMRKLEPGKLSLPVVPV